MVYPGVMETTETNTTGTRTWAEQLAEANDAKGAARDAYRSATTAKARRAADEDLQFWMSKAAFLEAAIDR